VASPLTRLSLHLHAQILAPLWQLHLQRLLLSQQHPPQVLSLQPQALHPPQPLLRLPKSPDFSLNSSG
jgi:hypothetical protein